MWCTDEGLKFNHSETGSTEGVCMLLFLLYLPSNQSYQLNLLQFKKTRLVGVKPLNNQYAFM